MLSIGAYPGYTGSYDVRGMILERPTGRVGVHFSGIFAGLVAWGGGAPPILASRASSLRRLASCCSSMVVIGKRSIDVSLNFVLKKS